MNLDQLLDFNQKFVDDKEYETYHTDKFPNKRMVIFTCMDTRLVELLPKALNIRNGDVKMVKNAGAIIRKPFDSIMKSLLVAIYSLKAEEVVVIGHYGCGMSNVNTEELQQSMLDRGIPEDTLHTLEHAGIDLHKEFHGFEKIEDSVKQSVGIIRNHPLLPKEVKVHGLIIDPATGKLDVVTRE
ncbi:beta-class carbonic anhydrase [Gracilibacillus alcaliphilus]|uniref:beta-class carbonic anhydrase n=1 Tax=Gracilibacillus alcaliphilus TaxID=1401441 RepID=UPI00195C9A15|nr:carbonic anhydrase [Gracilibacillus alcaliphilus]MBM7676469.1 carbonic anhydrase [Gracilibacillus alcaliphilus]